MPAPLIGLTTFSRRTSSGTTQYGLGQSYTAALVRAGAIPVMIPLNLPEAQIQELAQRLDGILFTGGGDVDPERYASQPHPLVSEVSAERDELEIRLAQESIAAGRPVMGICRGLQLINVAMGGTLYEDVLDQHPGAIRHSYSSETQRDFLAHEAEIEAGSRLAEALGAMHLQVNSLHHQAIRRLAPGLQVTSLAPDGIIEAVELAGNPFGVAVQWHPECLQEHAPMRRLFSAFAQAAQNTPVAAG